MSNDEISNILKTFYGEDLGYNSDDVDYEYYSFLKKFRHATVQAINSGRLLNKLFKKLRLNSEFFIFELMNKFF